MHIPRVVVAGLSGGGGKTLVSVGLAGAWRKQGLIVAPYKKGPDYIDTAWLSRAAGEPCRNLDLFLMSRDRITESFARSSVGASVAVIEGNRGLYDGMDAQGTYSTAELAKLLQAPLVIVVDVTKCTRTAAALVLGCQRLDPAVPIAGVVLNRIGGPRHEKVLRESIEAECQIPVLGAIPRLAEHPFPERHLGLVPPEEHQDIGPAIDHAVQAVEGHLDLDALWNVAAGAPPFDAVAGPWPEVAEATRDEARIGVFRDAAFQFYYPDNLEALKREGARLVEISPLTDERLPAVDALYIGGGFPETLAPTLAENKSFRDSVRQAVQHDLPVYAECGGAVFLGDELTMDNVNYPMCGAVPAVFGFDQKPRGHGYTVLDVVNANPFFDVGESLKGHEHHNTYLRAVIAEHVRFAFRLRRGHGYGADRDGMCYRNVLASYTHVHALGSEGWASALVRAAARHAARASHLTAAFPG
jgi:cobyrinic acid a,c-diamide synthase